MGENLLELRGLQTVFHTREGLVRAVDDVSLSVQPGEIIGIVGESGSGKSVSMMSMIKLISMPPGEIVKGEAIFEGQDILRYGQKSPELQRIRGGGISMIFQEPMTSLNPVMTIGQQIEESILLHLKYTKAQARARAIELLGMVGIPDPESRIDHYPNQFSGGMRQRVMIAMAISCNPKLLIADEATTALDVTTQEQILNLLRDLQQELGLTYLFIGHGLGAVRYMSHRMAVMYMGEIVETGDAEELFDHPAHPYTRALLDAAPVADYALRSRVRASLKGEVSAAVRTGCPLRERCPYALAECAAIQPGLSPLPDSPEHLSACRRAAE